MTPLEFANTPDGTNITVHASLITKDGTRYATFRHTHGNLHLPLVPADVASASPIQPPAPGPILPGENAYLNGMLVEVTDVHRNMAWITLPNGQEANTFIDLLVKPTIGQLLARQARHDTAPYHRH